MQLFCYYVPLRGCIADLESVCSDQFWNAHSMSLRSIPTHSRAFRRQFRFILTHSDSIPESFWNWRECSDSIPKTTQNHSSEAIPTWIAFHSDPFGLQKLLCLRWPKNDISIDSAFFYKAQNAQNQFWLHSASLRVVSRVILNDSVSMSFIPSHSVSFWTIPKQQFHWKHPPDQQYTHICSSTINL